MPNVDVSVEWTGLKELGYNLEKVEPHVKNRIKAVLHYHKGPATEHAKRYAPWTDRTGNARAGLHSFVESDERGAQLVVAHSVFYGIYLETRFSGMYAILEPTVIHIGDLIIERLKGVLSQMELPHKPPAGGQSTQGALDDLT